MSKILVAYATIHGSMQEIAEVVASLFREKGMAVDLLTLKNVKTLDGYQAVVMGAPLYMFHWHKDARRFLSRFQKDLQTGLPVAVFAGGPFGAGDEKEWSEVRRQVDQELAKFPWFKPVSVELVGGKFDAAQLKFPYNLIPAMKQIPANDLRDWEKIKGWAAELQFMSP
jgi:menaquinone-dependent protoporphyrinogen oxidase